MGTFALQNALPQFMSSGDLEMLMKRSDTNSSLNIRRRILALLGQVSISSRLVAVE